MLIFFNCHWLHKVSTLLKFSTKICWHYQLEWCGHPSSSFLWSLAQWKALWSNSSWPPWYRRWCMADNSGPPWNPSDNGETPSVGYWWKCCFNLHELKRFSKGYVHRVNKKHQTCKQLEYLPLVTFPSWQSKTNTHVHTHTHTHTHTHAYTHMRTCAHTHIHTHSHTHTHTHTHTHKHTCLHTHTHIEETCRKWKQHYNWDTVIAGLEITKPSTFQLRISKDLTF